MRKSCLTLATLMLTLLATNAYAFNCSIPKLTGVWEGVFTAGFGAQPIIRFHLNIDEPDRRCASVKKGDYAVSQPLIRSTDAKGTYEAIGGGCFDMVDYHFFLNSASGRVQYIETHEFTACKVSNDEFDIAGVVITRVDPVTEAIIFGPFDNGPAVLRRCATPSQAGHPDALC